jgi:hypothetical protein
MKSLFYLKTHKNIFPAKKNITTNKPIAAHSKGQDMGLSYPSFPTKNCCEIFKKIILTPAKKIN